MRRHRPRLPPSCLSLPTTKQPPRAGPLPLSQLFAGWTLFGPSTPEEEPPSPDQPAAGGDGVAAEMKAAERHASHLQWASLRGPGGFLHSELTISPSTAQLLRDIVREEARPARAAHVCPPPAPPRPQDDAGALALPAHCPPPPTALSLPLSPARLPSQLALGASRLPFKHALEHHTRSVHAGAYSSRAHAVPFPQALFLRPGPCHPAAGPLQRLHAHADESGTGPV